MNTKKIFISHCHEDRDIAVEIDGILKKHQAETFLDQDMIEVGDELPARLEDGIKWCNKFLLLWSVNSAKSTWVEREWSSAFDHRKSIIPYRLDASPLPEELQDRVYIDVDDKKHAHAGLLSAVFGRDFKPADPATMFPGQWEVAIRDPEYPGAKIEFDLKLRPNGQIHGDGHFNSKFIDAQIQAGLKPLGPLAYSDPGAIAMISNPIRSMYEGLRLSVTGKWSYDGHLEELSIDCKIKSSLGTSGYFNFQVTAEPDQIAGELSGNCMIKAMDTGSAISAPVTLHHSG